MFCKYCELLQFYLFWCLIEANIPFVIQGFLLSLYCFLDCLTLGKYISVKFFMTVRSASISTFSWFLSFRSKSSIYFSTFWFCIFLINGLLNYFLDLVLVRNWTAIGRWSLMSVCMTAARLISLVQLLLI